MAALMLVFLSVVPSFPRINSDDIIKDVQCIDIAGSDMNSTNEYSSTAICPDQYVLTGCGAKPNSPRNAQIKGAVFGAVECKVWTHGESNDYDFVRAYARCCNFAEYGSSFVYTQWSNESLPYNDARAWVSCEVDEQLIGCGGNSFGPLFDGAYAGEDGALYTQDTQNTCNAYNGEDTDDVDEELYYHDRGTWAIARCAVTSFINDGYDLQCIQRWGTDGQATSTVECPVGYFMTSCGAFDYYESFGQYVIENNICTVTQTNVHRYSAVANAICCQLSRSSDEPTNNPTKHLIATFSPTNRPTIEPSLFPTLNPSFTPTDDPSSIPSLNPSLSPTKYPTTSPSYSPSQAPVTPSPTIEGVRIKPVPSNIGSKVGEVSDSTTTTMENTHSTDDQRYVADDDDSMHKLQATKLITTISIIFCVLLCFVCLCWSVLYYRQRQQMKKYHETARQMSTPPLASNEKTTTYIVNEISMNTPCGTPLPPQSEEGNKTVQMTVFPNVFATGKNAENGMNDEVVTPGDIEDKYELGDDEFIVEDDESINQLNDNDDLEGAKVTSSSDVTPGVLPI